MTEKRLLPVSGKQRVKVFIKVGFQIDRQRDRQRGSHIVRSKGDIILVIPDHETVAKGTERALIKDAGLTVEEFNKLLKK
jgi:predicted RNA binding protein YcfA (HicA-like mRNA interferase family)